MLCNYVLFPALNIFRRSLRRGSLILVPALRAPFLLLGCLAQRQCDSFHFIPLYFILSCLRNLFVLRDRKGVDPEWSGGERGEGEPGGVEGGDTV